MAFATRIQAFLFDSAGVGEWMILLVVVLIVVGPKRLPEVARKLGRMLETVRRAADEFKRQIMTMDQPSYDSSTSVTDPSKPPEDDESEFDAPDSDPDYSPYPGNDGEYHRPEDGYEEDYADDGSGGDEVSMPEYGEPSLQDSDEMAATASENAPGDDTAAETNKDGIEA